MFSETGNPHSEDKYSTQKVSYRTSGLIEAALKMHDLVEDDFEKGHTNIDPYKNDIASLVEDAERMSSLERDLSSYDRTHLPIKVPQAEKRSDAILTAIGRHPDTHVQGAGVNLTLGIPLYMLMDIANRSHLGIYQTEQPALSDELMGDQFHTLSHYSFWREQLASVAEAQVLRLANRGIMPQVVMIGDGSGSTGRTIIDRISSTGLPLNVAHIDISSQQLEVQKDAYKKSGVSADRIASIQGDALKIDEIVQEHGLQNGFFVLNEVLDTFPTHALLYDRDGVREMNQILARNDKSLQAFKTNDPLINRLSSYFPWLLPAEEDKILDSGKMVGFSAHWPLFLKKLFESTEHASVYMGDYTGSYATKTFVFPPLRMYGHHSENGIFNDYLTILEKPIDITADVPASILHIASAWGGKVEALGSQADFLSGLNPHLRDIFDRKLTLVRRKLEQPNYQSSIRELSDDLMFVSEVMSKGFFGGLVTKGL